MNPPSSNRAFVREILSLGRLVAKVILTFYLPLMAVLAALHFPRDTDGTYRQNPRSAAKYYEAAYQPIGKKRGLDYEENARKMAVDADIEGQIRTLVKQYKLADKRILDVGSGRGYLQDVVTDYTGLDLSATVASYYHKPFVQGSATAMPFSDNSFDGAWSIWVLEHIPQPELALKEMRRVIRPGGYLFLAPEWNCTPWAADGFDVRPYSDFNWRGRLVKATLPVRKLSAFVQLYEMPIRSIRRAQYHLNGSKTPLQYRRLEPNYDVYWQPDSDAAVSIDREEARLWFLSRGDECVECDSGSGGLVLRVRK